MSLWIGWYNYSLKRYSSLSCNHRAFPKIVPKQISNFNQVFHLGKKIRFADENILSLHPCTKESGENEVLRCSTNNLYPPN